MSFAVPVPVLPVPVLSPSTQSAGSPACRRALPVVQARIQRMSKSREAGCNASPNTNARRLCAVAAGVVVSRGSPGIAVSSESSVRSSRVMRSPSARANAVTPAGPPSAASIWLAAQLSLSVTAASQISRSAIPVARCCSVMGECASRSALV